MPSFRAKPQHVYYDKMSHEKGVGVKEKYKLAGYQFPISGTGHPQLFWVLTSQQGVYPTGSTVIIEQSHWNKFDPGCLMEPKTYMSHDHSEKMTRLEALLKRRDPRNQFALKARLNDDKFEEFKTKLHGVRLGVKHTVEDLKVIATSTTNNATDAQDILKELHLF